jgi:hypothetical protein
MNILKSTIIMVVSAGLLLTASNCGQNPFGAGFSKGLRFFALFGKAMRKPEEEKNKKEVQDMYNASAKRLAKALSTDSKTPLPLETIGDTTIYKEQLNLEPHKNNPYKLTTGLATAKVKIENSQIVDAYSWEFRGVEIKTWAAETCSVYVIVKFEPLPTGAPITEAKPGSTYFWGKNITETHKGYGDSAYFNLGFIPLNDSIQTGDGEFYDANVDNSEEPESRTFGFNVSINHKGTYLDYSDNTASMNFKLPRENESGEVYFDLRFTAEDSCYGEIKENDENGRLLLEFKRDQRGQGEYTIYDEDGNAVTTESFGSIS